MSFEIGKDGITSIDFTVSLDRNATTLRMVQPYEERREFYQERARIGSIIGAIMFSSNSVEASYGSYSENTINELTRAVNALNERSIIDLQRHDEMIQKLKEMVAQVKIESEREAKQFESLLVDFKTNVESLVTIHHRPCLLRKQGEVINKKLYSKLFLDFTYSKYFASLLEHENSEQ